MDYGGGLENRFRASERGFESHPLRQNVVVILIIESSLITKIIKYKEGNG